MRSRPQAVLERLSLKIDPDALAESLSAPHRRLLQVARALAFDCRILVLDEPTTALTDAAWRDRRRPGKPATAMRAAS